MTRSNADTVLVTGGHGFLGSHLVDLLLERGFRVRCLLRPGRPQSVFGGRSVAVAPGDLRCTRGLDAAVAGTRYVFHLAGLVAARGPADFRVVNAGGTARLAEAVARAAPDCKRFVYVSSQAAAGPSDDGRPVTEDRPPRPLTHYGRSKLEGERLLRRRLGAVPWTILRPPAIYGPRDDAILPFFQAAARGFIPDLEGRGRRFNLLHARDVAGGLLAAAESGRATGRVYFLSESRGYGYGELKGTLERVFERAVRRVPVPDVVLDLAGVLTDEVAALLGVAPVFGREKARELKARWWLCSGARAAGDFGWRPRIPLDEGFAETARWYAAAGLLRAPRGVPGPL